MSITAAGASHSHLLRLRPNTLMGSPGHQTGSEYLGMGNGCRCSCLAESPLMLGCRRSLKHWADLLLFPHTSCCLHPVTQCHPPFLHPSSTFHPPLPCFVLFFSGTPSVWTFFQYLAIISSNSPSRCFSSSRLPPEASAQRPRPRMKILQPGVELEDVGRADGTRVLELGHS